MSPAVAYRTSRPRTATLPLGPFVGVRDSVDPTSSRPELARLLRNVYPRDPGQLSGVVGRPGFSQLGAQIGGGGDVQFLGQFTETGGTEHTIAIAGGRFYTYDWIAGSWSETLTAGNFSTASISVSPTHRIYAEPFAGEMVFTDGENTPWTWDGTTNGGLTSLTNAPVAFGPPTVYYGKLFFIKSTERTTFVWSEENAANTGYEAGGYNNAWTIAQTDANRLTCLIGANEALYVFREHSITQVFGEVTTNFQSTGTREAVSSTVGTSAPASVFFDSSTVFFADSQGRPHIIRPGTEAIPIWMGFDQTIRDMDDLQVETIEGYRDPMLELAVLAYDEGGAAERSVQLCYRSTGFAVPQATSVFDGYTFTRVGIAKNRDGALVVLHGSTDGYVYVHGFPTGATWQDGFNAGDEAIAHEVHTNVVAYSENTEAHYTRADLIIVGRSDSTFTVRADTSLGLGDSTSLSFDGDFPVWDTAVWDTAAWGDLDVMHGAVGLNNFGFYCGIRVTHESGAERFQFVSGSIDARPLSRYPGMP